MIPVPRLRQDRVRDRPVRRASVRSRSTGTESCTSSPSRRPGGWRACARRSPGSTWKPGDVDDFMFFGMLGTILGGRLGYVLFYGLSFWAQGSLVSHQGLGRRHVVPRRPARRDGRAGDFCRSAQAPDRRRIRFRRAAAGHRHLSPAHRQFHQRRVVGQTHRRAVGLHGRRRGAARDAALRSRARRPACCSSSCGGTRRSRGRAWRPPGCSWSSIRWRASSSSSGACPTST